MKLGMAAWKRGHALTLPLVLVPTLALALAAVPAAAPAQTISRIIAHLGLSPEDFERMGAAAQGLYDVPAPKVGSSADWSNPDTASHGRVILTGLEGACANLRHETYARGSATMRDIRLRLCRNDQGKWVLQP